MKIPYYKIEDAVTCVKEGSEWYPYAEDLEVRVEEVQFSEVDLQEIAKRYKEVLKKFL